MQDHPLTEGWDTSLAPGEEGLREPLRALSSFFPLPFWKHKACAAPLSSGKGAFLFLDVSGFTRISETLEGYGSYGTEILTFALNEVLGKMIGAVFRRGGVVVKFAGDAVFALFPGRDGVVRARKAAEEAMRAVHTWQFLSPSGDRLGLTLHGGIAWGHYRWRDLGGDVLLEGPWPRALRLADRAGAGEIQIGPWASRRMGCEGRAQRRHREEVEPEHPGKVLQEVRPYVHPRVLEWILHDPDFDTLHGEHRWMAVGFVHLHRRVRPRLERTVREVLRRAATTAGTVIRVDHHPAGHYRVLVVFGYPDALEHPALHAVTFARNIVDTLGSDVRVALHAGRVFAGPVGTPERREVTVMGDTVNTASRIAARTAWGETYLSDAIRQAVRTSFEARQARTFRLKGKAHPVRVWALGKSRPAESALPPPVGRESQRREVLAWIREHPVWAVALIGEAGTGKTHLMHHLREVLEGQGWRVLMGYGMRESLWAYLPWRHIVHHALDLQGAGVEEGLRRWGVVPEEWPLLGDILGIRFPESEVSRGLSGDLRERKRREVLFRAILGMARSLGPLVFWMEDAQWMDPASRRFLQHLWTRLPEGLPLGVALNLRTPEALPEILEGDPRYREVRLGGIQGQDLQRLVRAFLGAPLSPRSMQWLASRTRGNPLWVRETLLALREGGHLVRKGGRWEILQQRELDLPSRAETLMLSRVTHLPPAMREILQVGAVIGEVFSLRLMEEVRGKPGIRAHLESLVERGFLVQQGEDRFRFSQTLLREVLYRTLSFRRRRALHRRVARALRREAHPPVHLLAYHSHRGGCLREGMIWAAWAGRKARIRGLWDEALRMLEWALEDARQLGDSRRMGQILLQKIQVLMSQGLWEQALEVCHAARGTPAAVDAMLEAVDILVMGLHRYDEARKLIEDLGAHPALREGTPQQVRWWSRRATLAYYTGDLNEAVRMARKALRMAQRKGYIREIEEVRNNLGSFYLDMGRLEEAHHLLAVSLEASIREGDWIGEAISRSNLGVVLARMGRYQEALRMLQEVLRKYRKMDHEAGEALTGWRMGEIWLDLGDLRQASRVLAHALRRAREGQHVLLEALILLLMGKVMSARGSVYAARRALEESLQRFQDLGAPQEVFGRIYLARLLAFVEGERSALAVLEEGPSPSGVWGQAQFHLARAALLLPMGRTDEAQESLEIVSPLLSALPPALQATWWAHRAHLTLKRGDREAAVEEGRKALTLLGDGGTVPMRITVLRHVGALWMEAGETAGRSLLREAMALAYWHGFRMDLWFCLRDRGRWDPEGHVFARCASRMRQRMVGGEP